MSAPKTLTFVEIDIPYCALSYGVAPCTASGSEKCFNTFATCQDRPNFSETTITLRFAKPSSYLEESGIDAIPSIDGDVDYAPAKLSLGEKHLGARAEMRVTLRDHPHGDTGLGFDKYRTERAYDPYAQGTFWGKFRARHPILTGAPIRLIRGYVGQTLEEMETRHLLINGFDTAVDGRVTILGQDILKLADGDRALAPRPSRGYIIGAVAAGATSAQLGPAGIGNAEYPASGYLAIGGQEIVRFTRSGDSLTLTRGQFGTVPVAHQAQDRAQICLHFEGMDPANIIESLLVDFADTDPSYIPISDWLEETGAYLRRVYTALIAEPTPVKTLLSELIEQAALVLIPDDITRRIRLQVLRAIETTAGTWDETNIGKGTLRIKDQPEKRITNCVTYYGLINPLEDVDDPKNYRSIEAHDATDFDVEGQPRIKRIFSRWIPAFGRTVAERVNLIQIGRYRSAPRRFTFDIFRASTAVFGRGYRIEYWPLQLPDGTRESVPIQAISYRPEEAWQRLDCEEVRFVDLDEQDLTNRVIIIDGHANNLNLRAIHDSLFPPLSAGDTVTFIVNSGVIIGSTSTGAPALHAGSWPAGVVPLLRLRGRIQGMGGPGGRGGHGSYGNGSPGAAGGLALYTRSPLRVEFGTGAQIWGGAGGGGGSGGANNNFGGGGGGRGSGTLGGGGGAAGTGSRGSPLPGSKGSPTAGGTGGRGADGSNRGGTGGAPGSAGGRGGGYRNNTTGGAGGAAGRAIDGNSYVTRIGSGDIRGPVAN